MGVLEYLLFDPTGAYLGAPCRGWLLAGGSSTEWSPELDGRYVSTALGIAFRAEGVYPRTYDQAGELVPTREERRQENVRLRAEQERQSRENTRLRAELERLRSERGQ
jgi:hypothetical protein